MILSARQSLALPSYDLRVDMKRLRKPSRAPIFPGLSCAVRRMKKSSADSSGIVKSSWGRNRGIMNSLLRSFSILAIAILFASCAEPARRAGPVKAVPAGSPFDQVGKVTLYAGQPCTSQIMFVFRAGRSTSAIWLAAPMHETKILIDAAKRQRRVHVWGKWRRTKQAGCSYVEVRQLELQKLFW
jgi:hypothetical protein